MSIEHCRDIQNYIATKNAMKYWKECRDIKNDCSNKTEGRRLEVCHDNYTFSREKSLQEFKNNCCNKVCNVKTNHLETNNVEHGNYVTTSETYVAIVTR